VTVAIEERDAVEVLSQVARERSAALIVTGTRGGVRYGRDVGVGLAVSL
jgi:nucleotide-binding universal stress UspA family protein